MLCRKSLKLLRGHARVDTPSIKETVDVDSGLYVIIELVDTKKGRGH